MKPLTVRETQIIKEIQEKEERFFRVYENFRPNYIRPQALTPKFYSKAEYNDLNTADQEIVERIKISQAGTSKTKYSWPITENQCYGWFNNICFNSLGKDRRSYFGKISDPFILHEGSLKRNVLFKQEKFTGKPFLLNY